MPSALGLAGWIALSSNCRFLELQYAFADRWISAKSRKPELMRIAKLLSRAAAWGFLGLLLFMIGDGVESGYLSPFLISKGHSAGSVSGIFTAYGLTAGVSGWLSGALSEFGGLDG